MIAFGCAITDEETYERCASPGIALAAEPDSAVLPQASAGSIHRNYNLLLDRAAKLDDLEALVLIHQDAEIIDPELCAKVRAALADPQVALVGCAGAIGVRSIAWWEGSVTWASFAHRYDELGGGEIPAATWYEVPPYASTGEVDAIDGFVIAFSPWAVRELRFDESLGALHGYDFDICMAARAAGRKVVTADLRVIHHHSLTLLSDIEGWMQAYVRLAEKWSDYLPEPPGTDWRQRALRAEAEAAAARLLAAAANHVRDAKELHDARYLEQLQAELETLRASTSWRVTAPLRAVAASLRAIAARLRLRPQPGTEAPAGAVDAAATPAAAVAEGLSRKPATTAAGTAPAPANGASPSRPITFNGTGPVQNVPTAPPERR